MKNGSNKIPQDRTSIDSGMQNKKGFANPKLNEQKGSLKNSDGAGVGGRVNNDKDGKSDSSLNHR